MAATQTSPVSSPRLLLRHTLATLAYRGGKAVRNVPAGFESFRAVEGSRSAGEILAHIGDLFDWAVSMIQGKQAWHESAPLPWEQEVARFFSALNAFDRALDQSADCRYPTRFSFRDQSPMHSHTSARSASCAGSPPAR